MSKLRSEPTRSPPCLGEAGTWRSAVEHADRSAAGNEWSAARNAVTQPAPSPLDLPLEHLGDPARFETTEAFTETGDHNVLPDPDGGRLKTRLGVSLSNSAHVIRSRDALRSSPRVFLPIN